MNLAEILGSEKQIEFICMDCKKKIDTEILHIPSAFAVGITVAHPWLWIPMSLTSKLKGPVKVKVICSECIKQDKYDTQLKILLETYKEYNFLVKKQEGSTRKALIKFELFIGKYEKADFENIFSEKSLDQFIQANENSPEKFKRKVSGFLTQKTKKIINDYLTQMYDEDIDLSEQKLFNKLKKNKLLPVKECMISAGPVTAIQPKFCFDSSCHKFKFCLCDEQKSDFANAYVKELSSSIFGIKPDDIDIKKSMQEILEKKFISLYSEDGNI